METAGTVLIIIAIAVMILIVIVIVIWWTRRKRRMRWAAGEEFTVEPGPRKRWEDVEPPATFEEEEVHEPKTWLETP